MIKLSKNNLGTKCRNFIFILKRITLFLIVLHFNPSSIWAGVDIPWSTTYECLPSEQYSRKLICDGLEWGGGWTCDGKKEEITPMANFSYGIGGCGQRHWVGDGSNKNSGGVVVKFNFIQPEFWIRWYMRYEIGFQWNSLHYDKILYIHTEKKHTAAIVSWLEDNKFVIGAQNAGGHYFCKDCGWISTMGGRRSDGRWHCYEVHLKMDTNGKNGVAEAWIDNRKILSIYRANFGSLNGWNWIMIGSNQASPNNGRCMAVDFDDVAISNLGRIGPLKRPISDVNDKKKLDYQDKRIREKDTKLADPPNNFKIIEK